MPWYKTGTVKTTINSNAIIGTGTAFISNSRVGDAFRGPDGNWYEVVNIASDTAMSISPNYQGSTVAAGTYSIAPMQGYVKESADRLRQTVGSIGATLALFGGATNVTQLRANIGAAQNGTNSDITNITGLTTALSITQGGTGAKTAPLARTALGLGTASTYSVDGVGGIIERGSNSNGEYSKFADGTLICKATGLTYNFVNASVIDSIWTYPHPFAGVKPSTSPVIVGDLATIRQLSGVTVNSNLLTSRLAVVSRALFVSTDVSLGTFDVLTYGRWK